jgi:hypothetical protein
MLHAGKDITYIYVFTGVIPAFVIVIFAVTDNNIVIRKSPKGIVSETAYTALVSILAQTRNSLIDLITVWKKLATLKKRKKSFITTNNDLAGSGANKSDKSGSRHVIDGEEDGKKRARRRREARTIK